MEENNIYIKFFKTTGILIWVGIPVFFWLIPIDTFNTGPALCPSKLFFNKDCLGCGLTRASLYFHQFNFKEAFAFNKLIILIYPFYWMFYIHVLGKLLGYKWFNFLNKFY